MPSNNRNYSPLIGFLQDSLDIPGWGQQLSDMFIDHAGTGANPWQGLFIWLAPTQILPAIREQREELRELVPHSFLSGTQPGKACLK
jgi:hypothetical protein